jgi:hypothetical protein
MSEKPATNWPYIFREQIPWDWITFFVIGLFLGSFL